MSSSVFARNLASFIRNRNYGLQLYKRTTSSGSSSTGSNDSQIYCSLEPTDTKSCFNPSAPCIYDARKFGHNLPSNNIMTPFESLPKIPTGIFRNSAGERLGAGANKYGYYRNPEYFSFQHMTYYDLHLLLRCCRNPCPSTGRKP